MLLQHFIRTSTSLRFNIRSFFHCENIFINRTTWNQTFIENCRNKSILNKGTTQACHYILWLYKKRWGTLSDVLFYFLQIRKQLHNIKSNMKGKKNAFQ